MNITHYWANKLFDFQFRSAALAKPTAWHLAAFTTAPTAVAGSGVEVTGGSYARVACAPSDSNWYSTNGTLSGNSSGTSAQTSNGILLTFATPTADWGVINGLGWFDASTGGNMCYWLDFSLASPAITPITVQAGEGALTFDPASLVISLAYP